VERVVLNALINAALPPDFRRVARKEIYWPSAIAIVFGEADPPCGDPFLSCADI
jgi:hypothetical protein